MPGIVMIGVGLYADRGEGACAGRKKEHTADREEKICAWIGVGLVDSCN